MKKQTNFEWMQVPVSKLKEAEYNPRVHPDKGLNKLVKSIETFGFTNPILVQKGTHRVIAGHARLKAARKAGLENVPVIYLDFDDAKAKAYTIADNRLQEETEWDFSKLADLILDLDHLNFDMELTGFDAHEIENLMTWTPNRQAQEDDFDEEPPKEPLTRLGDLYELGKHRLLCGDCTVSDSVAKLMNSQCAVLMNTDPPYGINYSKLKDGIPRPGFQHHQRKWGDMKGDVPTNGIELQQFLETMIRCAIPPIS